MKRVYTYLRNSNYASGNPLFAVNVGNGVTLAATPVQPVMITSVLIQSKR
jgi:hypothetical protein